MGRDFTSDGLLPAPVVRLGLRDGSSELTEGRLKPSIQFTRSALDMSPARLAVA